MSKLKLFINEATVLHSRENNAWHGSEGYSGHKQWKRFSRIVGKGVLKPEKQQLEEIRTHQEVGLSLKGEPILLAR